MSVIEFFKALFAAPAPPDRWAALQGQVKAIDGAGQKPMSARITTGQLAGGYLDLPVPDTADREAAYAAVKMFFEAIYGEHVSIEVKHLCTTPHDEDEGTVAHSAKVMAACSHGLGWQQLCTFFVVTQGAGQ